MQWPPLDTSAEMSSVSGTRGRPPDTQGVLTAWLGPQPQRPLSPQSSSGRHRCRHSLSCLRQDQPSVHPSPPGSIGRRRILVFCKTYRKASPPRPWGLVRQVLKPTGQARLGPLGTGPCCRPHVSFLLQGSLSSVLEVFQPIRSGPPT